MATTTTTKNRIVFSNYFCLLNIDEWHNVKWQLCAKFSALQFWFWLFFNWKRNSQEINSKSRKLHKFWFFDHSSFIFDFSDESWIQKMERKKFWTKKFMGTFRFKHLQKSYLRTKRFYLVISKVLQLAVSAIVATSVYFATASTTALTFFQCRWLHVLYWTWAHWRWLLHGVHAD